MPHSGPGPIERSNCAYKERKNAKGKVRQIGRIAVATVAPFLEFGTHKMSARSFMTQAFEPQKEAALNEIIKGIQESLDEANR